MSFEYNIISVRHLSSTCVVQTEYDERVAQSKIESLNSLNAFASRVFGNTIPHHHNGKIIS